MKEEKNQVKITEIQLNRATYNKATLKPTNINFFIGKNGCGKSTIARVIDEKEGLTWKTSEDEAFTIIQVFDEDYIQKNIKSSSSLPGVFNISEADIEIQKKIDDDKDIIKSQTIKRDNAKAQLEDLEKAKINQVTLSAKSAWAIIKPILDKYPKSKGIRRNSSSNAYEDIKKFKPEPHSNDELDQLYSSAFNGDRPYSNLKRITIPSLTISKFLGEPIVSSGNSQFSSFINLLGAGKWVETGHEHYEKNDKNLCPYCQREMDESTLKNLSEYFNKTYTDAINELKTFNSSYESYKNNINNQINDNLTDWYPKNIKSDYETTARKLQDILNANIEIISKKIDNPSSTFSLNSFDVELNALNDLIDKMNLEIDVHNNIVSLSSPTVFSNNLKGRLAFDCKEIIELEITELDKNETARIEQQKNYDEAVQKILDANKEISTLSKGTSSTAPVVEDINKFLVESNFQGFSIQQADTNKYKLVRSDGSIAEKLSEGEKNFICFLYFYFSLFGSFADDNQLKDRVVVIDDPVSSMDSDSVFIISYLIRHIVETCKNAFTYDPSSKLDTHIKQLFILTHNAFFYNEIAPMYVNDYRIVSYFEIVKNDNISKIIPNIYTKNEGELDEKSYNYIPNIGTYATLWEEYKTAPTAQILLNVERRIIDAYFLQNLCITPGDLYNQIIVQNKDSFEIEKGGTTDYINIQLAKAMLCYIGSTNTSMNQSLYTSLPTVNLDRYKSTFKKIFEVMGQVSHYNMMMREK